MLAFLVHFFPHSNLDILISKKVQGEINEQRPVDISSPVTWVSIFGNPTASALGVVIISALFWITSNPREATFVLFVFIADGLNFLLKVIINRPRPTPDVVHVLEKFDHSSFPSGHVVHYVVFFGFLLVVILYRHKFNLPLRCIFSLFLVSLILTIPISRIYLGAHWATDVLGGYLIGAIFLAMILGFYFKNDSKY